VPYWRTLCDGVEIQHVGHQLLRVARLKAHRPFRIHDRAATQACRRRRVERNHVELVEDRIGASHHDLDVAIARRGQAWLQHHLRAEPGELSARLREAPVVADAQPDPAHAGHVERDELVSPRAALVRLPREHLAVAGDELAVWRDDEAGVVQPVPRSALEHGPGHQPQPARAGDIAEVLGERARDVHGDALGVAVLPVVEGGRKAREMELRQQQKLQVRQRGPDARRVTLQALERRLRVPGHRGGLVRGD
jgi:hypothetical protein